MRYEDFINNLGIHRTSEGEGKGVRCNIALYLYPDGHSNFYFLNDQGKFITHNSKSVTTPTNDTLETIDVFIDILYSMRKKAKRIR